jgi:signal transduction histidine kinase
MKIGSDDFTSSEETRRALVLSKKPSPLAQLNATATAVVVTLVTVALIWLWTSVFGLSQLQSDFSLVSSGVRLRIASEGLRSALLAGSRDGAAARAVVPMICGELVEIKASIQELCKSVKGKGDPEDAELCAWQDHLKHLFETQRRIEELCVKFEIEPVEVATDPFGAEDWSVVLRLSQVLATESDALHDDLETRSALQLDSLARSHQRLAAVFVATILVGTVFFVRRAVDRFHRSVLLEERGEQEKRQEVAIKAALRELVPDPLVQIDLRSERLKARHFEVGPADHLGVDLEALCEVIRPNLRRRTPLGERWVLDLDLPTAKGPRSFEVRAVRSTRSEALVLLRDITERLRLERDVLAVNDREQRRLSQDLHDGLCQTLSGLLLEIRSLSRLVGDAPQVQAEIKTIEEQLREALGQTRNLSKGLYPASLEEAGLGAALAQLARSFGEKHRADVSLEIDSAIGDLRSAAALHLFRIAREALSNAFKHGKAGESTNSNRAGRSGSCPHDC